MANYTIKVDGSDQTIKEHDLNSLDIRKMDNTNFHVLQNSQPYNVELLQADFSNKTLTVAVNGNTYSLQIEDEYDQMVKQMGLLASVSKMVKDVKAPMPGLIVDILVEENQEISEGDQLVVLSAMKMENIILAQGDAIVKSIEVSKGDAVEKGQLILGME